MMVSHILHISNSDIDQDSRIRKELKAVGELERTQVFVVGVPAANKVGQAEIDGASYLKLRINSRMLNALPRVIRYSFALIEFTIKVVMVGRRIKPDIVHCHDTFALPAGWILKKFLDSQLVYDAHELESNKNAQNAALSLATLLVEKFCWKQVDLLISVSDSITEWYMQNLGYKSNILVLNSPVIKEDPDAGPLAQRHGNYFHEKYELPTDHFIFVYLGILVPGRGIEICLDAFATGPKNAHAVFIGFGKLEQKIKEYAAHHTNIHFHQAVPHDQVVPLVRSADYGLCLIENTSLSAYYCLPNKLFEYCFARLPVLASNFPEISRLVDQYSLGVCCEPNLENVRIAIGELIMRRLACPTSNIAVMSWEVQARRLRTVYQNLLLTSVCGRSESIQKIIQNQTYLILHISNSDIDQDSRIRKELKAVGELERTQVFVVGVPAANKVGQAEIDGASYLKLRINSRMLNALPRVIRYSFALIEFTIKVVMVGRRIKPDIVHCHDTFALPAGWILKKFLDSQLVYDAHELESNKNAQNAALSLATLLVEKFCWKQVDLLISVSDSITEWYMQNLGYKSNILVLNSPVIKEDPDAGPLAQRHGNYFHEKYELPTDHFIFVYLGILVPGRGIEICLDAFATGPKNAHAVFIGFGKLEQKIKEYAAHHTNIHFHQAVPHDQVVPLVRSADYGLCLIENTSLSAYYCLPNKLFEYCFARLPVLASNFPEISRLVDQYSVGVCCDLHPDSVYAAVSQLIERRPIRPTSDITALSWESQAARLKSSYQNQLMAPSGIPSKH
jgi:glycosyltransferase involved in cell wall biosynthesis